MLMYTFLDKLMTRGMPWKQQSESDRRFSRNEMKDMKIDFRQFQGGQSETDNGTESLRDSQGASRAGDSVFL